MTARTASSHLLVTRPYLQAFYFESQRRDPSKLRIAAILLNDKLAHPTNDSKVATMVLARIVHYSFDAVMISAFLAGIRRSTGLTPSIRSEKISDSPEVNKWIGKYLGLGEWVMDQSVAAMGSSAWFERNR